jgi:hypothetical protein
MGNLKRSNELFKIKLSREIVECKLLISAGVSLVNQTTKFAYGYKETQEDKYKTFNHSGSN